jgi:hypothetical protein
MENKEEQQFEVKLSAKEIQILIAGLGELQGKIMYALAKKLENLIKPN